MQSRIRACAGEFAVIGLTLGLVSLAAAARASAQKMISVPTAPPEHGTPLAFRDGKFGVSFSVPVGWKVNTKDREVSTFRLDARSATRRSQLRAVASLDFNPYPQSVLSGALLYYSVERHVNDAECAAESNADREGKRADVQSIGGMPFMHGHDEYGSICTEGRDEIYTAFRKGSCYRFDLAVNTFCSISSGAQDLTVAQMRSLEQRMTSILSSVSFDWESIGPQLVPVPEIKESPKRDEVPGAGVLKNRNSGGY